MNTHMIRVIALMGMLLGACGAWAEGVGRVARIQGTAEAQDGTVSRPLGADAEIRAGDRLRTGAGSRLELHFSDGMQLTLSDGAEMVVDEFVWAPAAAQGKAALSLVSGSFLLQSGAVGKLPDHPLTVKTQVASVGVRGTRFWGGPLGDPMNVLLLEGRIVVSNAAGSVDLDSPGAGTAITAPGTAPQPPSRWPDERVARAFATVSFGP
ncbi:conserved exported hypothetical protein [Candidatus Terasakiella magnetica]|nr:conserved exported hypothetical protein [Candidatus Terasakiella magnetica]